MVIEKKTAKKKAVSKKSSKNSEVGKNNGEVLDLKGEIFSEIQPVLDMVSESEIANKVYSILELEIGKIKSEFDKKNLKSSEDLKNVVLDVEKKIISNFKGDSAFKKKFETFKNSLKKQITNQIEIIVSEKLSSVLDSSIEIYKKNQDEIDKVRVEFNNLRKVVGDFEEHSSLEIREEEKKQAQFLVQKINEVVEKVNLFEEDFSNKQNKIFVNFEKNLEKHIDDVEEKVRRELIHRVDVEFKKGFSEFMKKEKFFEGKVGEFKAELSKHVKGYVLELDKELKDLKKREKKFSLQEDKFMSEVKKVVAGDVFSMEKKLDSFKREMSQLMEKLDGKKERKVLNAEIEKSLTGSRKLIEEKLAKHLTKAEEDLTRINLETKESLNDLLHKTENSIFDEVEKFKVVLDKQFLKSDKKFEKYDKQITSLAVGLKNDRSGFASERKNLNDKVSNLVLQSKEQLKNSIEDFKKNSEELERGVDKKISESLANYVKDFEQKISGFDSEVLGKVDLLESEKKEFISQIEQTLANQVTLVSDHLKKVVEENKGFQSLVKEEVEEKIISANEQFKAEYDSHLAKFDIELKSKEEDFVGKLLAVEQEKEVLVEELKKFKVEVADLTKGYVIELDSQLEKIKAEEKSFEVDKEVFVGEFSESVKVRKLELDDFANGLKKQLVDVLDRQKQENESSENLFKENFNSKVNNLHNFLEKRVLSIEKKFVDKNLKFVEDRVEQSLDGLKLVEGEIDAKLDTVDRKVEIVLSKEDTLAQDIATFERNINHRVEERIMNMEKIVNRRLIDVENFGKSELDLISQRERELVEDFKELEHNVSERAEERVMLLEKSINKRFLDIEHQFTTFKGIVVDEVEDLMKEVRGVVSERIGVVDEHIDKINFAGKEVVKKIKNFELLSSSVQDQVSFVRDSISDFKVGQQGSMNVMSSTGDIVKNIAEYEQNLVNLVKSLQNRGISDADIFQTLVSKGHPMFYVNMVISNSKLLN